MSSETPQTDLKPPQAFPRYLPPDAGLEETRAYFADLLEWLPQKKLTALMAAGLTAMDIFALKRVARAYRNGTESAATRADLEQVAVKLENLSVVM